MHAALDFEVLQELVVANLAEHFAINELLLKHSHKAAKANGGEPLATGGCMSPEPYGL